jgi:hypothetical protein
MKRILVLFISLFTLIPTFAQSQDEIDALVAGKSLTFGTKKVEEVEEAPVAEEKAAEEAVAEETTDAE